MTLKKDVLQNFTLHPHLYLWYFHNKEVRRSMSLRKDSALLSSLDIQISDSLRMRLDELAARVYRITHEHVEGAVRLGRILYRHKQQSPVLGIHRCFPQLSRVHFAQTLIALKTYLFSQLFNQLIFFFIAIGILDLILICHPVQRRLGNIEMTIFDQHRHVAEEEG